jgi:hypothetical protein
MRGDLLKIGTLLMLAPDDVPPDLRHDERGRRISLPFPLPLLLPSGVVFTAEGLVFSGEFRVRVRVRVTVRVHGDSSLSPAACALMRPRENEIS